MRIAGLGLCALAMVSMVFYGVFARESGRQITLHQAVQATWQQADGPITAGDVQRAWVWGSEPLAATTEFYPESPNKTRKLIYFDKGRLDILDEGGDTNSPWFATGALLVSEMLSGKVQLGEDDFVERETPNIPLTGDLIQQDGVTYASLAPLSTYADDPLSFEDAASAELTAVLNASGEVDPDGMAGSGVVVGSFSDVTGHNIAAPFVDWARAQPYPDLYLLGHPISEPYWIQTEVLGTPKTVLMQAFQRRVMTYTPDIPSEWMVESSNAGQHYRLWRELDQPGDTALVPLASGEPFGEELVAAAFSAGVDPYMLVAISQIASAGNPLHQSNAGRGLTGVQDEDADLDPQLNAEAGATALREAMPSAFNVNWEAVLTAYYGSAAQVDATIALQEELVSKYSAELMRLSDTGEPAAVSFGGPLDSGPVAYYDPSYTTDWWEWALTYYEDIGLAKPGWANDPNGYYCVRPGYMPGERLRVNANGRTIDCTVGDMVADRDLANWLSKWSIEMNWPMFVALGLDQNNSATVEYPGDWPKPPPPVVSVPQAPANDPAPAPPQPPVNAPAPVNPPVEQPAPPVQEPAPAPPDVGTTDTPPAPPTQEPAPVQPTEPPATPTPAPKPPVSTPTPTPEPTKPPLVRQPIPEKTSTPAPVPPTATPEPEPEPEPTEEPPSESDGGVVVAPPPSR